MNFTLKDGLYAVEEFGCFVMVKDGVILQSPMLSDGSNEENWCEVEDPEPSFIQAIRFSQNYSLDSV